METIYKYELEITDQQFIDMPLVVQLLSVQVQGGKLALWALVDKGGPVTPVRIVIRGTGHLFDGTEGPYIDTVQDGFGFVWHVFVGRPQ